MMSTSAPAPYIFAHVPFPASDDHIPLLNRIDPPASSTRLSPASTASDSARSYVSAKHAAAPGPSTARPANNKTGQVKFITATHPDEFKEKGTMQEVRKQAMNNFLENRTEPARKEEKRKASIRRKRSDDSTATERDVVIEELADFTTREDALRLSKFKRTSRASPADSRRSSVARDDTTALQSSRTFSIPEPSPLNTYIMIPPAAMFEPMRPGKLPFDLFKLEPFKSIGRPLDPFRAMHQASYPCISVEQLKFHCSQVFGTRAMGIHWIPTLIKSPHAFLSTLCISSAHLDALNNRPIESVQTLALRQEVMHRISQHLVNPASQVDDYNIIAVTQLICSEIIAGSPTVLNYHESGVEKMVNLRGGLHKLGVNGKLASTLTVVSLQSAIVREATPRKMYTDYANYRPARPYANTATTPESPFWSPRSDLETIKRSQRGLPRTVDLLKDARNMTRLFLGEDNKGSPDRQKQRESQIKSLYKKIAALPAVADMQATTVLTSREWTYEVCRLAALIQGKAMVHKVPFSRALEMLAEEYVSATSSSSTTTTFSPRTQPPQLHTQVETFSPRIDSPVHSFSSSQSQTFNFFPPPQITSPARSSQRFNPKPQQPQTPPSPTAILLSHIRSALESSDISDIWSDFAGVLYWVTLVVGAASPSSSSSLYSTTSSTSTTSSSSSLSATDTTTLVVLNKWFRALGVRCAIKLCFEHEDAVLGTLGRAGLVLGACCVDEEKEGRSGGNVGGGKRRRVS